MSEYEETMGADFCEHDIVDSYAMSDDGGSHTGSTRRRSSFGIIRNDGTANGSLRRRNRVSENGVANNQGEGENGDGTVAPTQIVISTIDGHNQCPPESSKYRGCDCYLE